MPTGAGPCAQPPPHGGRSAAIERSEAGRIEARAAACNAAPTVGGPRYVVAGPRRGCLCRAASGGLPPIEWALRLAGGKRSATYAVSGSARELAGQGPSSEDAAGGSAAYDEHSGRRATTWHTRRLPSADGRPNVRRGLVAGGPRSDSDEERKVSGHPVVEALSAVLQHTPAACAACSRVAGDTLGGGSGEQVWSPDHSPQGSRSVSKGAEERRRPRRPTPPQVGLPHAESTGAMRRRSRRRPQGQPRCSDSVAPEQTPSISGARSTRKP